jgi:hypothetical protein
MSLDHISWPTQPNGEPVPSHRKSWKSITEGKPVFCASSWRKQGKMGVWTCGYCLRKSSDPDSPNQHDTLADCINCGYTNRISL